MKLVVEVASSVVIQHVLIVPFCFGYLFFGIVIVESRNECIRAIFPVKHFLNQFYLVGRYIDDRGMGEHSLFDLL